MTSDNYSVYRHDTGEKVLGVVDLTNTNPRAKGARLFEMLFIDVPLLTLDKKLTDFDVRLFVHLAAISTRDNAVRLFQDEIASAFGVTQPTISKSLRRLRTSHYLEMPREGVITLNPEFVWKDTVKKNVETVKAQSKLRQSA